MADRPVTVVLGATGGIGSAVTRRLAQRGDRVVVAARGAERARALAGEVGGEARPVDATDAAAVSELLGEAAGMGSLACVVNAVGSIVLRPAHLTSPETVREVLDANLVTAFNVVRAAPPLLRDAGGGSILLFGSAAARIGLPNHEAIAAAKGAVAALARSAAATYASWGVRVNVLSPGLVDTPLTASITGNERALERSLELHPLGRIGTADDVAAAALWILEPGSWVTGQEVGLDGGLATLKS